jgi:hypothetical protein
MTTEEKYLFDLMGYLVVEDVLDAAEIAELNALLDRYDLWQNKGKEPFVEQWNYSKDFIIVGPVHKWDDPFRRLIGDERMLPYLLAIVGEQIRYDIGHAILMRQGDKSLTLHGGNAPFNPAQFYEFREGVMFNSLLAVSYALADAAPGEGGFAAIPGSHKANFACPDDFKTFAKVGSWIQEVPVQAGSAIIFSEAMTHGTWPWKADHERRQVLYKYSHGSVGWTREYPLASEAVNGLSDVGRRLLQPPWVGTASEPMQKRPSIVDGAGDALFAAGG